MATDPSNQMPAAGYLLPAFSPGFLSNPVQATLIFAPLDRALERFRGWTDQLRAAHTLAEATGSDLDDLGAILGLARLPAETDTAYRVRIPSTVQHSISASNGIDLQAVLAGAQGVPVVVTDWPTPPGFDVLIVGNTPTLSSVPGLVRRYKAAGVPFTVRVLIPGPAGAGARMGTARMGTTRMGGQSGMIYLT